MEDVMQILLIVSLCLNVLIMLFLGYALFWPRRKKNDPEEIHEDPVVNRLTPEARARISSKMGKAMMDEIHRSINNQ